MCRWFAYISAEEDCLLEDVLITPKHSLSRQVHDHYLPKLFSHDPNNITTKKEIDARNRLFNIDGLGVAWYTEAKNDFIADVSGLRPALYKTIQPPLNDLSFRSICANTATKCCFAHIRATSATAVTSVNNHPFAFGRHSFMHNGYISDFVSIRRELCLLLDAEVYGNVLGSTDSEHMAALYMTYLTSGRGKSAWEEEYSTSAMASALHKVIGTVISLQQKILGSHARPNDLNLAATDGKIMIASRFRNHATEQPPSLKYPDHPDGIEVKGERKDAENHGSHVIVASEPSTYKLDEWELIGKNCVLKVEKDGSVKVEKLPYEKGWNATDD